MTARSHLALAGLAGLGAGGLLTALAVWLASSGSVPRVVPPGWSTLALLGLLLFFSLAEMPLMIFTLRRLVGAAAGGARTAAMLTAAAFVFFAAVYAAPFTVLTGRPVIGGVLAALCLVRLASVLMLVPGLGDKGT
jgi:hypothetical protein